MFKQNIIPDRSIDQKVGQQLSNHGMRPPCKVMASSKGGTVTLTGKIQYEHQRNSFIQTARRVEGVQRVVDQLQVIVKEVKKDGDLPGHRAEPLTPRSPLAYRRGRHGPRAKIAAIPKGPDDLA